MGDRCHPDQCGDLAPVQPSEFGQLGDERGAGDRTDAAGGLQQRGEVGEALTQAGGDRGFQVPELRSDGLDHRLDARAQHRHGRLQALVFGAQHGQQLAPARDERSHLLLLDIGQGGR